MYNAQFFVAIQQFVPYWLKPETQMIIITILSTQTIWKHACLCESFLYTIILLDIELYSNERKICKSAYFEEIIILYQYVIILKVFDFY